MEGLRQAHLATKQNLSDAATNDVSSSMKATIIYHQMRRERWRLEADVIMKTTASTEISRKKQHLHMMEPEEIESVTATFLLCRPGKTLWKCTNEGVMQRWGKAAICPATMATTLDGVYAFHNVTPTDSVVAMNDLAELEDGYGAWLSSQIQKNDDFFVFSTEKILRIMQRYASRHLAKKFLDPIVLGAYPPEMSEILGSRLPTFSSNDKLKLKSSLDFIGINHYTSLYAKDCQYSLCNNLSHFQSNGYVLTVGYRDSVPIGQPTAITDIYVTPHSLENIVLQVMERFNNPPMIITENGYGRRSNNSQSSKDFLNDEDRIGFLTSYLTSLYNAIRKGADVRGYYIWSILYNFEWVYGYTVRFDLYYVDRNTMQRTPKLSAKCKHPGEVTGRLALSNRSCCGLDCETAQSA
ncbi:Beta-glucosidase 18 [Platanthera guangdongensis]|uniref:Beta-glucosidase 18 n=1 Tax=Platanthera guangdongensis TaxID=2320717 RepID=A0ABR2MXP9_9ASPA